MSVYTVRGTYGSGRHACNIFVYPKNGGFWYAIEDSVNANFTYSPVEDGVYVEELEDIDCFTWDHPILDEDTFEAAVDD